MTEQEKPRAEKGDWVQVWGQVVSTEHLEGLEEYSVRFRSHSEDYRGLVHKSYVEFDPKAQVPSDVAEPCPAMKLFPIRSDHAPSAAYVRCQRHLDHPGLHKNHRDEWTDAETAGYFEVKS